jgi:hypothetical protein
MVDVPTPDTARANVRKSTANAMTGTRVLPVPDSASTVAGMPRSARVHTEPGDAGNIAPETQIAATEGMHRPQAAD